MRPNKDKDRGTGRRVRVLTLVSQPQLQPTAPISLLAGIDVGEIAEGTQIRPKALRSD